MKKIVIFLGIVFWPLALFLNREAYKIQLPPPTIFAPDYQAQQKILRDTKLYSSVFLARAFHNKARIRLDKFSDNIFALIDPNNYFFGFAPRQKVGNQNSTKYPFAALPFFLFGVWQLKKYRYRKIIITFSLLAFFGLALLANFDGYDFILWFPISAAFIHGVNEFEKRTHWVKPAWTVFIVLALVDLLRILR